MRARAAALVAGLACTLAAPVSAATWSQGFAAETDTVLFLAPGGGLWKAPFHLGSKEVLWEPDGGQRLFHIAMSPDRRSAAWLSLDPGQDTIRFWIWHRGHARLVARFKPVNPPRYGIQHFQASLPSLADRDARGARFIRPSLTQRQPLSRTLTWSAEGSLVAFGYEDGLAVADAEGGVAREVSKAMVVDLELLDPAPVFLAECISLDRLRPVLSSYLLYPTGVPWKAFSSAGFAIADPWTSDGTTIWWGEPRRIRAVRAHDPTPTLERETRAAVTWLGHGGPSPSLVWVEGGRLLRATPPEAAASVLIEMASDLKPAIESRGGRWLVLGAGDSIAVWNRSDDVTFRVAVGDGKPIGAFEEMGGDLIVAIEGDAHVVRLVRVGAATRASTEIEAPGIKHGRVAATPRGDKLILYETAGEAPGRIHLYDIASAGWVEVENPGLMGWEPLAGIGR